MFGNEASYNPDASQEGAVIAIESSPNETDVLRQLSTTEYLAGMIHTDSPPGLLPLFPSWSLICLGKPALYIPSQGTCARTLV